jgi:hypothetical protein
MRSLCQFCGLYLHAMSKRGQVGQSLYLTVANAMQFPKDEVEDYQRQLLEIAENLRTCGACKETNATLMERYAQMLMETVQEPNPTPEKLVTDLLARCLLWADIVKERYVVRITCHWRQLLTVLGLERLQKGFANHLRSS